MMTVKHGLGGLPLLLLLFAVGQAKADPDCFKPDPYSEVSGLVDFHENYIAPVLREFEPRKKTTPSAGARFLSTLERDPKLLRALRTNNPFMWKALNDPKLWPKFYDDPEYRRVLSWGASLHFLWSEPSGVAEGYTVGEHTIRVLDLYEEQKKHFKLKSIRLPPGVHDADKLLKYTLAFHDIGKSVAVAAGNKSYECEYSEPLARILMKAAGFSKIEVRIAVDLVHTHQMIGSFLKGEASLEETVDDLSARARSLHMTPGELFKLQEVLYVADSASYPSLQEMVFQKDATGKLVPRAPSYQELVEAYRVR
jgi:hypothetical protein